MSFCVVVRDNKIDLKYERREKPYFTEKKEVDGSITFFSGEYHSTYHYFEEFDWTRASNEELLAIEDSFAVVKIDKETNKICFANSKYGIERLYYYDDEIFVISDDFWEIVSYVKPSYEDIDIESIEECMNGCYPMENNTFVKKLYTVLPGCRGEYSLLSQQFNIEHYFEFKYLPKKELSIQEATDFLNNRINETFIRIKEECGDVTYGFGLSGGLDSRIIPHYIRKNDMRAKSFIIGNVRPNFCFLSGDHKRAREIAGIFGLKLCECKWSKEVLKTTITHDIKNNPLSQPQFFKGQYDCQFDILITGGNGYMVGSTMPNDIENISSEELVAALRNLGRDFKPNTIRNTHIEKVFELVFKKNIKLKHHEIWYDILLNDETERRIYKKYCQFVEKEKRKGKSNIDIYEGYFHNILGARNKFGGFESLSGTHRSFSIYLPFILEQTFQWPLEFLENRRLLKNLILTEIPEVSMVKEQKYEGNSITKKISWFSNLINIMEFIVRGNGSEMVNSNFRKCKDMFMADMQNGTEWFYRIFPINTYLSKVVKHDNKYALMKIWKMKLVIDALETEKYMNYISKEKFINFL